MKNSSKSWTFEEETVTESCSKTLTVILVLVLSSSLFFISEIRFQVLTGNVSHFSSAPPSSTSLVGIQCGLATCADTSLLPGQTVTFAVNLTNAPPVHAYTVSIQYNPKVLSILANGIDPSGGLLGNQISTFIECIDGQAVIGSNCSTLDSAGVMTLSESIVSSGNSTESSGILFTVKFNILTTGASQIHVLKAEIIQGANYSQGNFGAQLDVQIADGYFSNKLCGGQLCQPPTPSFTITPLPPIPIDKNVTFDAIASTTPNSGARISFYTWFWNEAGSSISTYTVTTMSVIDKAFFIGNQRHFITLTVNDTYNIEGYFTMQVQVIDLRLDIGVDNINAKPVFRVLIGTPVNVTAVGENLSTNAQNVTLEIFVGSTLLANKTFANVHSHSSTVPVTVIWDTHGFSPKIYRVEAVVPSIRDSNGRIIEDDAVRGVDANNMGSVFVQLVETAGSGLVSLSLVQTTGLGILVLIGVGVAFGFFSKRRNKMEPVPLE